MSKLKPPEKVKLIVSVFSAFPGLLGESVGALSERCGQIDFISAMMAFDCTRYYEREMGGPLWRRFVSFETLIRPESLPDVKRTTNEIEEKFTREARRCVNIDPGYLSRAHLILATGKGYTHRPYLRDGVYAEVALIYQDKTFTPLPWTYPDYAQEKMRGMFNRIRERYLLQSQSERLTSAQSAE